MKSDLVDEPQNMLSTMLIASTTRFLLTVFGAMIVWTRIVHVKRASGLRRLQKFLMINFSMPTERIKLKE